MNTEKRDRAFDRIVIIDKKDKERLMSILGTIPREVLIMSHTVPGSGKEQFILKIKKQELLMIKLAIETKSVSKVKSVKRKKFSIFS